MTHNTHNLGLIRTYSFAVIMFLSLFFCLLFFPHCNPIPEPPQPTEPTDTVPSDTVPFDTIPAANDIIPSDTLPTDTIPTFNDDTINCCPTGALKDASLVVIKLANPDQIDNVVVCKQQKKDYGNYWVDFGVREERILTDDFDFYGMDSLDNITNYNIFRKYLQLPQKSPYIELTEGYYLIDWRWAGIFPTHRFAQDVCSAYANEMNVLSIKWSEWDNVFEKWNKDISHNPLYISNHIVCFYHDIDKYRNEKTAVFGTTEWKQYNDLGISAYLAMRTYNLQGEQALEQFIIKADSVYDCYKKTLIDAIEKNKLNEFAYETFCSSDD